MNGCSPFLLFFPDPRLVDFVRSRKTQNALSSMSSSIEKSVCPDQALTESKAPPPHYSDSVPDSQEVTMDTDEEDETELTSHHPINGEHCFNSYMLNCYYKLAIWAMREHFFFSS